MKKYVCLICGYGYDEAMGLLDDGIVPNTKWQDLPKDWICPICSALKDDFSEQVEVTKNMPGVALHTPVQTQALSAAGLSCVFSNLAKGAEKQYKPETMVLYNQLADYYLTKVTPAGDGGFDELRSAINAELDGAMISANSIATDAHDRGVLRTLKWSEKVSRIISSLVSRYLKQGASAFEGKNIHVCEICGFIYVGNNLPDICPVCKVPNFKLTKTSRRTN